MLRIAHTQIIHMMKVSKGVITKKIFSAPSLEPATGLNSDSMLQSTLSTLDLKKGV